MPEAQLLSMVSRAATPWKLVPYPTLVGTAMTGQLTSPPTTLARAPSMPATTTITLACCSSGRRPKQPVQAGHAHVVDQLGPLAHDLGRDPGLLATGISAVPAVTMGRTLLDWGRSCCSRR